MAEANDDKMKAVYKEPSMLEIQKRIYDIIFDRNEKPTDADDAAETA